eukprot:ctg_2006.g540
MEAALALAGVGTVAEVIEGLMEGRARRVDIARPAPPAGAQQSGGAQRRQGAAVAGGCGTCSCLGTVHASGCVDGAFGHLAADRGGGRRRQQRLPRLLHRARAPQMESAQGGAGQGAGAATGSIGAPDRRAATHPRHRGEHHRGHRGRQTHRSDRFPHATRTRLGSGRPDAPQGEEPRYAGCAGGRAQRASGSSQRQCGSGGHRDCRPLHQQSAGGTHAGVAVVCTTAAVGECAASEGRRPAAQDGTGQAHPRRLGGGARCRPGVRQFAAVASGRAGGGLAAGGNGQDQVGQDPPDASAGRKTRAAAREDRAIHASAVARAVSAAAATAAATTKAATAHSAAAGTGAGTGPVGTASVSSPSAARITSGEAPGATAGRGETHCGAGHPGAATAARRRVAARRGSRHGRAHRRHQTNLRHAQRGATRDACAARHRPVRGAGGRHSAGSAAGSAARRRHALRQIPLERSDAPGDDAGDGQRPRAARPGGARRRGLGAPAGCARAIPPRRTPGAARLQPAHAQDARTRRARRDVPRAGACPAHHTARSSPTVDRRTQRPAGQVSAQTGELWRLGARYGRQRRPRAALLRHAPAVHFGRRATDRCHCTGPGRSAQRAVALDAHPRSRQDARPIADGARGGASLPGAPGGGRARRSHRRRRCTAMHTLGAQPGRKPAGAMEPLGGPARHPATDTRCTTEQLRLHHHRLVGVFFARAPGAHSIVATAGMSG